MAAALASVTSIKLPNLILAKAASKSHAHRALVNLALNQKLTPLIPESNELITLSINLPPDLQAKLIHKANELGMSFSAMFAALANAGLKEMEKIERHDKHAIAENKEELEHLLILKDGDEVRPKQREFWLKLASGLSLNKVVMAEGTTGVGKGRAIISAAIMLAKSGKRPVLIAAPTIKVLADLYDQYAGNKHALAATKGLSIAFLPGRQEFVDSAKLKNYLGNARADLAPKVRKWVEDGAPSKVACALSDVAKRCGTRLAWLTDDLRDIAGTDLRAEDFSLTNTSDKSCEGAEQHALLRELAAGADIVFCSHKMLALQGTTNWALLPQVVAKDEDDRPLNQPAILIDEAHMFEEAVASATSQELSLFSLRSRLARRQKEIGGGPGSALAKATILTHQLMDLCSKDIYDHTPLRVLRGGFGSDENVDAATSGMLLEKMAALRKLLDTRGTIAGVEDLKNDKAALSGIIRSLQDGDQNCLLMTFSPEKKFPSFSLGSPNVAGDLKRIWDRATGGVGLISATFWLPSWDGKLRTEYIRSILNLPLGRVHCPEPVVWEEIYSVPTRYLPAKEISAALIPPDDFTSQEKMNRWCTAQSAIMSDLLRKPKGGALVLCTSYVQVRTLHEQLVVAGVSEERIIDNSGRLSDDRDKYIALYRRGTMPIFLALGPAWTGFDLKDDKAKLSGDDMLLADLIITRVPLGLNKSVTHEARSSRNFNVNANEACLKLKQGLGRLIRRPGLRDRRLIILDGRLTCDPGLNSTFLKNLANAVYLLIKHYKKKVVIGS